MGNKNLDVLRNSECNGVIVKKELVDEADFTGEVECIMTVDRTLIRAFIARIEVDTPFYTGNIEATCMKNPLFDLIGTREEIREGTGIKVQSVQEANPSGSIW